MNIILTWIGNNFIALSALLITPILTYILNRRRQVAETDKIDSDAKKVYAEGTHILLDSSGEVIKSWQQFATEMKTSYENCRESFIKETDRLSEENKKFSSKFDALDKYTKRVETYTTEIKDILERLLINLEATNPRLVVETKTKLEAVTIAFKELKD